MKRAPSKKTAGGEHEEEECPRWVQGVKCVLDIMVTAKQTPTMVPPIRQYLEEVSLGMVGSSGEAASQAQVEGRRRPGEKATPADCMQVMVRVIAADPAVNACQSMFWLVLGAIFGIMDAEVTPDFRQQLGEAWYAFTLQVMSAAKGDQEVQDWILAAMPPVFGQAIYRLLVDGFVEDRKQFIQEGQHLLTKVCMVAHFELTGFQINVESLRRLRQRRFQRQVLQHPHVNQRQALAGKKRQEILESTAAADRNQPLEFAGVEARRADAVTPTGRLHLSMQPLEESQLEHVMQTSDQRRRDDATKINIGNKAMWEIEPSPVPTQYSVARYKDLAKGSLLLDRQLEELNDISGQDLHKPEDEEDSEPPSPVHSSLPDSEVPSPTGASPRFSEVGTEADWTSEATSVPTTPSRPRRLWRRTRLVSNLTAARIEARKKKEREIKAKKLRQDTLQRKCAEPLPKDLTERSMSTTWVSPAMQSLQKAPTRCTLQKTSAETFQLKMMVQPVLVRRLSMPSLASSGGAGEASPSRQRKHPDAASQGGGAQPSPERKEESIAGSIRTGTAQGQGSRVQRSPNAAANEAAPPPSAVLPRVAKSTRGEVISLDAPSRISQKEMKKRLEVTDKAAKTQSFAIYMKEHDIFTGVRKLRFDEKRLRDEEDAYVKKMCSLVGGSPKRLLHPEGERLRRSESAPGGIRATTPPAVVQDTGSAGPGEIKLR